MLLSSGRYFDGSGSVVLLNELTLDNVTIDDAAAEDTVVGNVVGATGGSTLSLQDDAGGRFKLVAGQILAGATPTDYDTAQSHDITIRETLAGASNSPRDTVIEIAVNVPLPNFANTVLFIEGYGGGDNRMIADESAALRGFPTINGNVAYADSSPAPSVGSGTITFDGSGDWLEWADHADWTLGTLDFTLAAIVSFEAGGINLNQYIASHYNATTNQRGWGLGYDGTSDLLNFVVSADGVTPVTILSGAFDPTADEPYFVLITRSGDTWRMHAGAVSAGVAPMIDTATNSISVFDANVGLMVGRLGNTSPGAPNYMHGSLNTLVLALNEAWQANDADAVIPTQSFERGGWSDPYWPWVVALLGFEGTDGSTTFTDESPRPKTYTPTGNAQIDTAEFKYGSASGLFDGAGDRISPGFHTDYLLGSKDFTIETWAWFTVNTTNQTVASVYNTTGSNRSWYFQYNGGVEPDTLTFGYSEDGTNVTAISGNWTPTVSGWYHLSSVRKGSSWKLRVDGVEVATHSASPSLFVPASTGLRIGNIFSGSETNYFNGRMDEFRFTRAARYDADFTPPAAAYPRG